MVLTEAAALNKALGKESPLFYSLLSPQGKAAFFSKKGILSQTAEARGTRYNATIGQAFEDDTSPMVLPSMHRGFPKHTLLYSPASGQVRLRELWKKHLQHDNPKMPASTSMPLVVNGITHGLFIASQLFCGNGEKIILPEPFWGNYKLIFQQGAMDTFPLFVKGRMNVTELRKKLCSSGKKKIVLLNFPNNPTGYTPTWQEARELVLAVRMAAEKRKQVLVILDDAYFGLGYEKEVYSHSLFQDLAQLHERVAAVKVDGLSKEGFAWGLRVGFITFGSKSLTRNGAAVLENKATGVVRATISNVSSVTQYMAIQMLDSTSWKKEQRQKSAILEQRYREVKRVLEKEKAYKKWFEALPFNSGYFMCLRLQSGNAELVRQMLLRKYNIGVIAIGHDLIRIAYSSLPKKSAQKVFENLAKSCQEVL